MAPADGLLSARDVRRLAATAGLRPRKARGQNFVVDPNTVRRIVRLAGVGPTDTVLEVGPGLGSLTLGLLGAGAQVVAVEIEPVLARLLPGTVGDVGGAAAASRLAVLAADASTVAASDLPRVPDALVSNLPYNVAVPVLLGLLERVPSLAGGLVMMQQEVAERLTASPGGRVYGAPTVKLGWWASAELAGRVSRDAFWPVPNVDSALVAFRRQPPPRPDVAYRAFTKVVDAAFGQRRKMLRSALASWAGSAGRAERLLKTAGIDPSRRGETLLPPEFADVAAAADHL
ncbi:MAG: 16S rRNA (adenine(1518)-N(6)/adenine(1519)-N(6))-dimethyltransferase RsmA [Frankiaceae bacterium]